MGRVAIAQDNRTGEGGAGFPSIKLTEKGQKTRFTVIEVPWREYVHYVKAPRFNDDGSPKKEKKHRKNGDEYEDYDLELIGTEICLGDIGTLKEKGIDDVNCPACEASVKSGGDIPGPIQRFAVNVVEYTLNGNTWNIRTGKAFSATVKVWKFTGRIYDEIEGIQQEIGDLRKHDLSLECEDPYWNRNKLSFKMEPGYQHAPPGYLKELLTTPGNKATDAQLRDACGREVPRARMQEDCDFALRQWRKVRDEGSSQVPEEFVSKAADLSGGIEDLLGEETADAGTVLDKMTDEQKEAAGTADDPFAEFAAETAGSPSPPAAAKKVAASAKKPATTPAAPPSEEAADPTAEAAPTPGAEDPALPAETGGDFDFDSLLDGV
jgi:hypothetical protein